MFASGSIDLGAPILAYEAKAQIEVTSDTYIPITITSPSYSQSNSNQANEFNPNIDLVIQNEVTQRNSTVQVQLENEPMIKTQTIIIDSPRETKIVKITKESEDQKSYVVLTVILTILAIGITGFCIRYIFAKKFTEKLDVELKI